MEFMNNADIARTGTDLPPVLYDFAIKFHSDGGAMAA